MSVAFWLRTLIRRKKKKTKMRRTSRNSFNFDFSLRRLLLQGARAARGSPPLGQRLCDVEKASGSSRDGGGPSGSSSKHDKGSGSSHSGSHKHNLDSTSQHSANSPGNLDRGTSTSKLTPNSHKSSNSLHSKSTAGSGSGAASGTTTHKSPEECPLCYDNLPAGDEFFALLNCKHYACRGCLENYLMIEISESRTDISCPQCPESMHPTDIQTLLKAFPAAITKYEDFMVRRVLLADPDSRWCPGPDCSYAVVASGCASCPRIRCERPGCDVQFCYHCKAEWHPDQTCDAARASRQSPTRAPSEDDTRYKLAGKHKRNLAVLGGVTASVIVSPVLAGLAVAIGVPILLFYVYGVVPVSLCRAGCGEGTKFEFDEEEDNGSRNHDATSVDAVSRIGATSIGEVSLSVASGSHLGVSSQHSNFGVVTNPSTRESTTALAGSITGHRLEVQADISTSETASAVTCVSEKSGNTLNDTASTKALAGSILSYRAQQMATDSACFSASEDGASERVRFDNTDTAADKASLGSGRSFRSSERSFRDDFDSTSLSSSHNTGNITTSGSHHSHGGAIGTNPSGGGSGTSLASSTKHPRMNTFGQRIPKLGSAALQHRTLSIDSNTGSYNIPENVSLEQELEEQDQQEQQSLSSLTQSPKVTVSPVTTTTDKSTSPSRTMADEPPKSRTHILRNLFFAQTGSGTAGSRDNSLGSSPKS